MFPIVEDRKYRHKLWVDVRELCVKYIISVEQVKRFFEGLSEGKVYATRCRKCGEMYFPPQAICPRCRSSEVEWVELSGEGKLLTYTKIYVKPKSFSHYSDYVVAVGRLDEGVNVTAWIDAKIEELKPGMRIKLVVVKRKPEGYLTYGWRRA